MLTAIAISYFIVIGGIIYLAVATNADDKSVSKFNDSKELEKKHGQRKAAAGKDNEGPKERSDEAESGEQSRPCSMVKRS